MALQDTITIQEIQLKGPIEKTLETKGGKSYKSIFYVLEIIGNNNKIYTNFQKQDFIDLDKGDTLSIIYQSAQNPKTKLTDNRIISFERLKTSGGKTMSTQRNTGNTGTNTVNTATTGNGNNTKNNTTGNTETTRLITLTGMAFYPCVHNPNAMSEKYQMDFSPDEESEGTLNQLGIELRNKNDERGNFVTLKTTYKPTVLDSRKNIIPSTILIGNGSKVKVKTSPYNWTFKGKKGTSLGLNAVQVLDLVEYKGGNIVNSFDQEDGFTVDQTQTTNTGETNA